MNPRSGPGSGGVTGKGFMPGESGNPRGRPRAFASVIREETAEGEELVRYVLGVFRNGRLKHSVRMEAADWLANRGWGRPHQSTSVSLEGPSEIRIFPPGTKAQDVDAADDLGVIIRPPAGDNGHDR